MIAAPASRRPGQAAFLTIVGMSATVALLSSANRQLTDSNFVFLWGAVSLLHGDRPSVDFFEWGAPLAAYLSAAVQVAVGYRVIGELLLQWSFIIAGVMIAFHLGAQLAGSRRVVLAGLPLALVVLANTPTYHYSKLFFFPLAIWLAWRYVEAPGARRSAAMGAATAIAFLSRHDYVIYAAIASATALVVAPLTASSAALGRRPLAMAVRDAVVCGSVAVACIAPWALAAGTREGLVAYTQLRAAKNEAAPPAYLWLRQIDPMRVAPSWIAAQPGEIGFVWNENTAEPEQQQIKRRLGLRRLEGRDAQGRLRYAAPDLHDRRLLELDPHILDGVGIPWDDLRGLRFPLRWWAPPDAAVLWLLQVSLLVPLALLAWAATRHGAVIAGRLAPRFAQSIVAALTLAAIGALLYREPSYATVATPLVAAFLASMLARPLARPEALDPPVRRVSLVAPILAGAILLVTTNAALAWARPTLLFNPAALARQLVPAFAELIASPPVRHKPQYEYARTCTTGADHLLVTGSTPFDVPYYTERPVAGGHLYWHQRWGSDPGHEAQSLALLERQSVPLAVSTQAPVLDELAAYPHIRAYVARFYREVPGTHGAMLYDGRRTPSGQFGVQAWPCFGPR